MKQSQLNKHHIFSIPAGDYFNKPIDDIQLVYAPLTENVFVSTPDFVEKLEQEIESANILDEEVEDLLNTLKIKGELKNYLEKGILENGFNTMLILPNNICNFTCSYCYSAKGRSGKKLSKETITTALNDFINPDKIDQDRIFISILGGGEPMMTWELTKHIIVYAYELSQKKGFTLRMSLVTNGSIITEEMIKIFKQFNIRISVSFEILEEIQNLQRGQYSTVDKNIRILIDAGVHVRIRSTITKESVHLQKKMVETVIERYPEIENIILEEVTDEKHFNTPANLSEFYNDFLNNFNDAFELGKKNNKEVECSTFRNNEILIDRFCPGVLCLTPEGTYSSCSRISSPNDTGYEESIYGRIEKDNVLIDQDKLTNLINDHNVYSNSKCFECYTKWHCGGGCYAHKHIYSEQTIDAICNYKRKFTKLRLLKDLDTEYQESYGKSLKDFILEKIDHKN